MGKSVLRALVPAVAAVLLGASAAWAQGPPPGPGWHFELTPYLWAASLSATLAVQGSPTVEVDTKFGDIVDVLDFGASAALEARNGPWGILLDTIYVKLSTNGDTPGPLFSRVDVVEKSAIVGLFAAYRLWDTPFATLDVFGGTRIWIVETEFKLTGAAATTRRSSQTKAWADPVVGAALRARVWDNLFASLIADVGGFGIASDVTWQAFAGLSYELSERWVLKAGYRAIGVDYSDGGFKFDAIEYGPVIGVGYRF